MHLGSKYLSTEGCDTDVLWTEFHVIRWQIVKYSSRILNLLSILRKKVIKKPDTSWMEKQGPFCTFLWHNQVEQSGNPVFF